MSRKCHARILSESRAASRACRSGKEKNKNSIEKDRPRVPCGFLCLLSQVDPIRCLSWTSRGVRNLKSVSHPQTSRGCGRREKARYYAAKSSTTFSHTITRALPLNIHAHGCLTVTTLTKHFRKPIFWHLVYKKSSLFRQLYTSVTKRGKTTNKFRNKGLFSTLTSCFVWFKS